MNRERAAQVLRELGIPERHASDEQREQHRHPEVCCCWIEGCDDERACNVNALMVETDGEGSR